MYETKLLIGGKDVSATGGATFDRKDPVTGEVATRAAAATVEDVNKAVEAAAAAFPVWSQMGPSARRMILLKAADIMQSKAGEVGETVTSETGATLGWGGFNVMLASNMLREAASMTTQITGEVIPSDHGQRLAMSVKQPCGVLVGIAPWNAPIILGTRAVAMPLACGNSVILKASELCPQTHRIIVDCLKEAGIPDGAISLITNAPADAPKIVEALISHPKVKRINFTGSTRVGKIIAEIAGRHLKPVLLELGGKNPLVLLDDADIADAVNSATFGAFMNQGQICMSTERIVVDEKIADAFVEKFAAKAKSLPIGNPRGNVVLGALVDQAPVDKVNELIKDAVEKGAKLVIGGHNDGTIMEATILDHVTPKMRIYSEESFGPVTTVVRGKGVDELVRIANDTEYGLSSAVFGADIARAIKVARRIESGICHINGTTVDDEAQMPFGGVKGSGYGRFGGKMGIDQFTETRWITIETDHHHYPF